MPLATIADLASGSPDVPQLTQLATRLSDMYEEFLKDFREEGGDRHAGIHASELNKCMRQAFYSLLGEEKRNSVDASWRKRFEVGHAVHDMVQRHFRRMALRETALQMASALAAQNSWEMSFEKEVRVDPGQHALAAEYYIQSSCDGIFTFTDRGTGQVLLRVGLEIKTEAPDSYENLKSPREDHVAQAHVYMACLDLPLLWFFYWNKGNQSSTPSYPPWLIYFDPARWKRLEDRAATVLAHAANGTVPPREEGTQCQFCPYSWKCQPPILDRGNSHRARKLNGIRRTK